MQITVTPMAELAPKTMLDRFVAGAPEVSPQPAKSTKTAEAVVPTGGSAVAGPAK